MSIFDAIIIGAGQAGPSLAGRLTGAGMTVALIERKLFGGTCVNTGCTPTKTLIASAYAANLARRGSEYGFSTSGAVKVDIIKTKARAEAVSATSRVGIEKSLRDMVGCTVIKGHAYFEAPYSVRVKGELITAPRIFINVGARAFVPEIPGIGDVPYLTNSSILALDRLPAQLIIVGGSYIGLEFAQVFRRFGSQVTIIENGPHLIAREDEDISESIREILVREGITVRTSAKCISLATHERDVTVGIDCSEGEPACTGSHVMLAVGRQPNTDDLGLEKAGIETDKHGYIKVDNSLSTNVPGIWALGDCNGRGAFTHTAYNDFEIVAANLLDGERRLVTDRLPAYALYIDPPLGRAGITEREACASGKSLLISSRPMTRVNRAIEKGETQGFMKVVVDAATRKILGAAILGTGGDEAIHAILNIMNAGVPYDVLMRSMPIHPTVSELIPTMLSEMYPSNR